MTQKPGPEEREPKTDVLRQALIEGEDSGGAGELDMEEIKVNARHGSRRGLASEGLA